MLRLSILIGAMITIAFSSPLRAEYSQYEFPFVPNFGQWSGDFQYKAQIGNLDVYAEGSGFTYVYSENTKHSQETDHDHVSETIRKHAFRLRFTGAQSISFKGEKRSKAYYNYFKGADRTQWKGHVPLFEKLRSTELYPGISILAYQSENLFKYDYIIEPGSDPDQIVFIYSGTDGVSISKEGLLIKTSVGDILESIPLSYQIVDGKLIEVQCVYAASKDGFGFSFPEGYNTEYPLIIDPVLVASTLSGTGSGGSNYGHGAAFDLAGNIYTHAISFNSNYPVTEGAFQEVYGGGSLDIAISKFNPDGSELIYATFIGGAQGEYPHSIITNNNQELYIVGSTSSSDFPTTLSAVQPLHGGNSDIFLTVLSSDGSEIIGSTYLGGSENDGVNMTNNVDHGRHRGEVYVDMYSNVYVASSSSSDDFPTTASSVQPVKKGNQDGVVVKLNPDLSQIIWSTFVGSEEDDMVYGIRTSQNGNVLITGGIGGNQNGGSADGFSVTPGAFQETFGGGISDAFVAEISSDGSTLVNSTLLGGTNDDAGLFIDIDNQDNIWIYMQSTSVWQTTEGVWGTNQNGNMLVHKLKSDLSELLVTSYLSNVADGGGSGYPVAFMVDLCNNVYVSCHGANAGLVTTDDALFESGGFYLGAFTPDMEALTYGTFYTGSHVDGGTSRFDKQGIVYQGVCSGGSSFNTTANAYATGQATGWDIGVFKIDFEIGSVNAVADAVGMLQGCAPHSVEFTNYSSGHDFFWDFDDGNTSSEYSPSHTFPIAGDYLVSLVVIDQESCNISDTVYIPISIYPEVESFIDFDYSIDCSTGEVVITDNSSGPEDLKYVWDMGDGTLLTDQNPTYIYDGPGEYIITLTLSSAACNVVMVEERELLYLLYVNADFDFEVIDICDDFVVSFINSTSNGESYIWDMGDGAIIQPNGNFEHIYQNAGAYLVELIANNPATCNLSDTVQYIVEFDSPPVLEPAFSAGQVDQCNELIFYASAEVDGAVSTFNWFVNGELISNEEQFEFHLPYEGDYFLELIVTDPVCENTFNTSLSLSMMKNLGFRLPPSSSLCYNLDSIILDATVPYPSAVYNWNNGESFDSIFTVESEGEYEVTVSYNGCSESQSTTVRHGRKYDLVLERHICANQPNSLRVLDDVSFIETVDWSDGQTGYDISVSSPGYYPFTALDIFGCDQIDSLLVIARDADTNLFIPNVFTPNGDGKNDVFQVQGDSLFFYHIEILNRWGRKVFSTSDINDHWDGVLTDETGKESHDNHFFYILKYRGQCDLRIQAVTGNVTILR